MNEARCACFSRLAMRLTRSLAVPRTLAWVPGRSLALASAVRPAHLWFAAPMARCVMTGAAEAQVAAAPSVSWLPWPLRVLGAPVQRSVAAADAEAAPSLSWLSWPQQVLGALGLWLVKRTYQPSVLKRNRTVGFLERLRSASGRRTIERRRLKGRHKISVA